MTDQEMLMIERHCERLITRYCHYIDHGEAAKVADLFTADGTWTAPGVVMSGQDELRKGFTSRQQNTARMSRHVCNNLLIDVIDADHAHGVVYLTLYMVDGEESRETSPLDGPALVGEYIDEFVRTEAGWRIKTRATSFNFVRIAPM